jgi:predicted acylesterase/phospholipase RssA
MRRFFLFLTIFLLFNASFAGGERPKVGLVLSGGGAKGFAEIHTLKLLDSLQIPIDYIAGTSIGSIIGGLYAIGYSGAEIEDIGITTKWSELFTDTPRRELLPYLQKKDTGKFQLSFAVKGFTPMAPSGLISGQKISLMFSGLTSAYEATQDFDQFPIPFRAVAVDLVTGNEVVLRKGSLARAMRSSMSIPTVFQPVVWGDSLLVDGGMINNLPIDVVREMGADIVIAVNVGAPLLKREDITSVLDVLEQSFSIFNNYREKENIKQADILISPDMSGFDAADFNEESVPDIIKNGRKAARAALPQLIALRDSLLRNEQPAVADNNHEPAVQILSGISISGSKTYQPAYLLQSIGYQPGDTLSADTLSHRLFRLQRRNLYAKISHQLKKRDDHYQHLFITVEEGAPPRIYSVSIENNQLLPFDFIYNMLGIRPGETLDTKLLQDRITYLYSLGYFEKISYDIHPVNDSAIRLHFHVEEKSKRILRLGLRYDNNYQLVAAVNLIAANLLVPGLMFENEIQFPGLVRWDFKVSFPSRTKSYPIYPFIRFGYKDIPTDIYSGTERKIAQYQDRSFSYGAGVGILFDRFWNVEVEYSQEDMRVKPNIALADELLFPVWRDKLRHLVIRSDFDLLDDILLPGNGIRIRGNYESGFKDFGSDIDYNLYSVSGDLYTTPASRHTFRLNGSFFTSSLSLPIYKYYYNRSQEEFIGMNYFQLSASQITILRMDYRYRYKKDIFFKLAANTAFNTEFSGLPLPVDGDFLFGAGAGIILLSPVGPIELLWARGSTNIVTSKELQNVFYFSAGYKF